MVYKLIFLKSCPEQTIMLFVCIDYYVQNQKLKFQIFKLNAIKQFNNKFKMMSCKDWTLLLTGCQLYIHTYIALQLKCKFLLTIKHT